MQKTIIADTSCLILLEKINELDLLQKLFGIVWVTTEIANEFESTLPDWISMENPVNKNYQRILEASLDKGEASAIALAIERGNSLLIIDDLKGWRYAERLGISITGTLGVIVTAKLSGKTKSVRPILDKIRATHFRLTSDLERGILEKSNE